MKSAYRRPRLVVYGRLEEITKSSSTGTVTDAAIPAGTPFDEITFS